jgi:hypothetical protein
MYLLEYRLALVRLCSHSFSCSIMHSAKALWYQIAKLREFIGSAMALLDHSIES